MSEYSGIRGTRIKYLASDPTLNTSTEGQVWYNSTSGTLKSLVQIKAWSSGGNMNTARNVLGGAGIQTSALAFGGDTTAIGNNTTATEEYSGFSWSNGGSLNTSRRALGGAGTQTAGLGFGGYTTTNTNATEEYDGSAWTSVNNMGTARRNLAGAGIQTSGLAMGGNGPAVTGATEEYDGTTWTAGGTMNTARQQLGGCGTQNAGLVFGGSPPVTGDTEEYDGSTWTAGGAMNTGRISPGGGVGVQTSALAFGGSTPTITAITEEYDGTNWTSSTNLSTARTAASGAGTRIAGLAFGGSVPPTTAATEEYVSSIDAYSPSTVSAWASSATLNTSVSERTGFGNPSAGAVAGGTGVTTNNEEYNGSAWTEVNNLNTGRSTAGGAGPQTAAFIGGGTSSPTLVYLDSIETYDGSTWTTAPATFPYTVSANASAGTQAAGLFFGGFTYPSPGARNETWEFDGTAITPGGAMNTARRGLGGAGTQTAALAFGGNLFPPSFQSATEEYNGSIWTSSSPIITARGSLNLGVAGTQTAALAIGGSSPARIANTELYNGTSWVADANYPVGMSDLACGGTTSAMFGAASYPGVNTSNEYTGGSPITPTGAQASTLTTS